MDSEIWDSHWKAPAWSQSKKRLARTPVALSKIAVLLELEQKLGGKLAEITPRPTMSENTLFFSAIWVETGTRVFIKVGCTRRDLFWANALQGLDEAELITAKTFASGETLGDEDIRWFVMEQVSKTLDDNPDEKIWDALAQTVTVYQKLASKIPDPVVYQLNEEEFGLSLNWGIEKNAPAGSKILLERLSTDWEWVAKVCPSTINFGDLTTSNALSRKNVPEFGDIVLVDPIPRIGPWIYDPAYCQVNSSNSDIRLIEKVGKYRGLAGLPTGNPEELEKMSKLMLGWMATMWWGLAPDLRKDQTWSLQANHYIEDAVKVQI